MDWQLELVVPLFLASLTGSLDLLGTPPAAMTGAVRSNHKVFPSGKVTFQDKVSSVIGYNGIHMMYIPRL